MASTRPGSRAGKPPVTVGILPIGTQQQPVPNGRRCASPRSTDSIGPSDQPPRIIVAEDRRHFITRKDLLCRSLTQLNSLSRHPDVDTPQYR